MTTLAEIGRKLDHDKTVDGELVELGRDLLQQDPHLTAEQTLTDTLHAAGAFTHALRIIDERCARVWLEQLKGQGRIVEDDGGSKLVLSRKLTTEEKGVLDAIKPSIAKLLRDAEYRSWFQHSGPDAAKRVLPSEPAGVGGEPAWGAQKSQDERGVNPERDVQGRTVSQMPGAAATRPG